jgi:lipopolysaccharide export LptBFGC system permease protein LptF
MESLLPHAHQLLSQPSPSAFRANNVHLDVRLALGWSASLIAFAAAYHAYRHPSFQQTRPYVLAGVVSFVLLGAAMNAYARWVEGDVIYQGKRKLFAAGRVGPVSYKAEKVHRHVCVY